jgi:hypothetical protein
MKTLTHATIRSSEYACLRTFGNKATNNRNDDTLDRVFGPLVSGFLNSKDRQAIASLFRPITNPLMRLCAFLAHVGRVIAQPFIDYKANIQANREEVERFNTRRAALMTPRIYTPWEPKAYEEKKQPTKKTAPRTARPTAQKASKKPTKKMGKSATINAGKKTSPKIVTSDLYSGWKYADLQWQAKEWGLKANGKREDIIKRLIEEGKARLDEKRKASKVRKTA